MPFRFPSRTPGEAGTVGSLSAGVNAIVDALSVLGIRRIDTPCTPYRVWQAIANAGTKYSIAGVHGESAVGTSRT